MAVTNGSFVRFIELANKAQYNQWSDKTGAIFFLREDKKIVVDGVEYGFNYAGDMKSVIDAIEGIVGGNTTAIQEINTKRGAANGIATLDNLGKVPAVQLPSYVDDLEEYAKRSLFPTKGESDKIYVDKATNTTWRWSGSGYTQLDAGLALGETSSTAFAGDKGKQAHNHIALKTNPHGVTASQLGVYTEAQTDAEVANQVSYAIGGVNTNLTNNYLKKTTIVGTYSTKAELNTHAVKKNNPHAVTAAQTGAYTDQQTDAEVAYQVELAVSAINSNLDSNYLNKSAIETSYATKAYSNANRPKWETQ